MSRKRDRRTGGDDKGLGAMPSPDHAVPGEDSIPVDLGAVRADDEFIEALLSKPIVPTRSQVDYELAGLLSTWRDDVVARPIGQKPTLEDVEAGIAAAARRGATQRRSLRIARYAGGAVAAVALVFGGVSAVAHNAAPGDPLWGVKEVMFGADASSTLAMADVEASIDRAAEAFVAGDKPAAKKYLDSAESKLGDVRDAGDRASLARKIDKMRTLLDDPTSGSSTSRSRSGSESSSSAQIPVTVTPSAPTITVTVPQETVTITPSETDVSEPAPSSSETEPPPLTILSEPPTSEPPPSSAPSSEVPVVPPG